MLTALWDVITSLIFYSLVIVFGVSIPGSLVGLIGALKRKFSDRSINFKKEFFEICQRTQRAIAIPLLMGVGVWHLVIAIYVVFNLISFESIFIGLGKLIAFVATVIGAVAAYITIADKIKKK